MNVVVFCGSSAGTDPLHRSVTHSVGKLLAARGHTVVYGGGHIGLMGALADSALAAGGEVVGVIPGFLARHELAHTGLTRLVVVDSMHDRKRRMSELADAYLVLGGGFGTLDELFEILTWKQVGLHDKPIVICNVAGAWDGLYRLLQQMTDSGFVRPSHLDLLAWASDATSAIEALERAPRTSGSVASKLT